MGFNCFAEIDNFNGSAVRDADGFVTEAGSLLIDDSTSNVNNCIKRVFFFTAKWVHVNPQLLFFTITIHALTLTFTSEKKHSHLFSGCNVFTRNKIKITRWIFSIAIYSLSKSLFPRFGTSKLKSIVFLHN